MLRTLLLALLLALGQRANASPQAADAGQASGGTSAAAQQVAKQSVPLAADELRVLQPGSPKPVQAPPFSFMGGAQCDSRGNMYFRLAGSSHSETILEIFHDGIRSAAYFPPKPEKPDALGKAGVRDFFVSPSGKVYELLHNEKDQGTVVIEFDSDGSVRDTVKPEVPERLQPLSLAVFDDGTLLIQGFIHILKPGEQTSDAVRSYVALFDASGKLRKELTGFPDFSLSVWSKSIQDGGVAIGQDGNAYLLDANSITVISETGEIARRMPYKKPDPDLIAPMLTFSDGLIAIKVLKHEGGNIISRYLVVRADNGETVGYYSLLQDESNRPVALCFSRNEGFTFLKLQVEEQKLTLVNAPWQ